ncbi:hypothetical protein J6590_043375 [Homalodisca vitripennis]|nr:hypothetical protein J6590_043375 [Homalodisca vitripennis]
MFKSVSLNGSSYSRSVEYQSIPVNWKSESLPTLRGELRWAEREVVFVSNSCPFEEIQNVATEEVQQEVLASF